MQCTHDLVGEGHFFGPQIQIWKDLGPGRTQALEGPGPHVHLKPWSLTMKGVQEAQKEGMVWFWSLSSAFWQKLFKTKVAGHPKLLLQKGRSRRQVTFFGPQIWIWKDLGLVCFWSLSLSLSRGVYNMKVVVYVQNWTLPNRG